MVIRNTGCLAINNATAVGWFVIDGESTGRWRNIPANGSVNFDGTIFPWCYRSDDIRVRAFRFFRAGAGAFYMFQTSEGFSQVLFSLYNGGNPSFDAKQTAGPAADYVDVNIDANGIPSTVVASYS